MANSMKLSGCEYVKETYFKELHILQNMIWLLIPLVLSFINSGTLKTLNSEVNHKFTFAKSTALKVAAL